MTFTKREMLIAALKARGEEVLPETSRRYVRMTRKATGQIYFIGKAGGFRVGRVVAETIPASETLRKKLLLEGALILKEGPRV
jgi:hypothetical protein